MDGALYESPGLRAAGTDAEIVASLYATCGFLDTLNALNGDFAIALYDSSIDTLWLARDRFGIKPLYYVLAPSRFAFASRPRPLLGLPDVSPRVNDRFVALFAVSHYRYADNDSGASPYADVSQLPAAHALRMADGRVSLCRYWSPPEAPDSDTPEAELADQYRELLLDAVALRLRKARRPAFTLSGGMDSSSVLASAVRVTGIRQPAFSTVYVDKTYDESDEIRPMVEQAVEPWHAVRVDEPDVVGLVRRMIDMHDEPVATATWLSHFLLCESACQHGYGSLFGGLGGDEVNAGEYEHFLYHFADLRAAGHEAQLAREVDLWARYHDHPVFRKNGEVMEAGLRRLVDFSRPGRCLPDRARLTGYLAALDPGFFDLAAFEPVLDHPFSKYLKNRTYQDLFRETVPCCLRAEDRQTTTFGLDNFLPFFDHRLVEFMFGVPGTLKIRNGVAKHLLRAAMRRILPEETRTRIRKTGWNAPAHLWFSGPGRDLLLDLVHSRSFRQRGIYHLPEVERLIREHDQIVSTGAQRENHMSFLWKLVNLELWLRSLETNHG